VTWFFCAVIHFRPATAASSIKHQTSRSLPSRVAPSLSVISLPHNNITSFQLLRSIGGQDAQDMEHGMSILNMMIFISLHFRSKYIRSDCCLQKQKQQQDANADAAAGTKRKKVTAAQLRVQKGMIQK